MQFVRRDEEIITEKENNLMRDATVLDQNRGIKVMGYETLGEAS